MCDQYSEPVLVSDHLDTILAISFSEPSNITNIAELTRYHSTDSVTAYCHTITDDPDGAYYTYLCAPNLPDDNFYAFLTQSPATTTVSGLPRLTGSRGSLPAGVTSPTSPNTTSSTPTTRATETSTVQPVGQ
jgi:hypothetical protein